MRQHFLLFGVSILFASISANAATQYPRVVWDSDPAHKAVIGFSPVGSISDAHIKLGNSTNESSWVRYNPNVNRTFNSSLSSYFVRLNNLTPNTAYYFRVCDASGCDSRYWFRTAASSASDMTFITGGDSRTNRSARQQGNRLVGKIRPQFVMFGGDYTDNNTASQMQEWLADWQLSFSSDSIDGQSYKQIYPLVPTVGNHEDNDQRVICLVFGVDSNNDGNCSLRDSYNAFNVGGNQFRLYTLNTELRLSGYEAEWSAQDSWLSSDLSNQAAAVTWRLAQYHKPMFPRTSSKPLVNTAMFEWAQRFYDHRMNLVIESDSHLVKYTYPVKPASSSTPNLTRVTAGTVYIGEGAWGAPTRTADRVSDWVTDQDSFAHLNIVQANGSALDIYTARFSGEAATSALTRDERLANPLALPTGLSFWQADSVGERYRLQQDSNGRSTVPGSGGGGGNYSVTLRASDDVTVGNNGRRDNGTTVFADGSDAGEILRGLLRWQVAGQLPAGAEVTAARIRLRITNRSTGSYDIHSATTAWSESSATWSQASLGGKLASFTPSATGWLTINLPSNAISTIQNWVNGATQHGIVLSSAGTNDGVDLSSSESSNPPEIIIDYRLP